jgi:hypothetical protein
MHSAGELLFGVKYCSDVIKLAFVKAFFDSVIRNRLVFPDYLHGAEFSLRSYC